MKELVEVIASALVDSPKMSLSRRQKMKNRLF